MAGWVQGIKSSASPRIRPACSLRLASALNAAHPRLPADRWALFLLLQSVPGWEQRQSTVLFLAVSGGKTVVESRAPRAPVLSPESGGAVGAQGGSTAVPRSLQSACEVQISAQATLRPKGSDFQLCLKFWAMMALSLALQELHADSSSHADKNPLLAYLCLLLQRMGGEVLPHAHLAPSIAGISPLWFWCCFIPSFFPRACAAACLPTSCDPQAPRCSAFLALGRYFGCVAFLAHKGFGDGSEAALHLIRLD